MTDTHAEPVRVEAITPRDAAVSITANGDALDAFPPEPESRYRYEITELRGPKLGPASQRHYYPPRPWASQ